MNGRDRNQAPDAAPAAAPQPTAATRRLSRRLLARATFLRRPGIATSFAAQRWAAWARALAARHLATAARAGRAALVLERRAAASAYFANRIVERTLARTTLVAPQLHLTIAPLLRLGVAAAPASFADSHRRAMTLRSRADVSPAQTAALLSRRDRSVAAVAAPTLQTPRALAARGGAFVAPPALTLARARRQSLDDAAEEPTPLARRVAAQRRRVEVAAPRPSATLHRPPATAPPPETVADAPVRPRRTRAANATAATTFTAATPGAPFTVAPGELDRLTEQVVRRIDRRMTAWRERTGRVG